MWNNMIEAIEFISKNFPNFVFGGSFGLYVNRLITRVPKDIDVITDVNYYGTFMHSDLKYDADKTHSEKNSVNGVLVYYHSALYKDIKIDFIYNTVRKPIFTEIMFKDLMIKVETPEAAIEAKLRYITIDKSDASVIKNVTDLIEMKVDYKVLFNALKSRRNAIPS